MKQGGFGIEVQRQNLKVDGALAGAEPQKQANSRQNSMFAEPKLAGTKIPKEKISSKNLHQSIYL
jgi:hypothetical protein